MRTIQAIPPLATAEPSDAFVLGPATRLLWRSAETVQLELGRRSVVLSGLTPSEIAAVVARRPGRSTPAKGLARSARNVLAPDLPTPSREALAELAEHGFLWTQPDARPADDPHDDLRLAPPAPRLAGELTALAARHGDRAAELLAARQHAHIAVQGHPRVAPLVAALLAAGGVGRVSCPLEGTVRLLHSVPGGVEPADEGVELAQAAEAAVRRAAPDADTGPRPGGEPPDLTILATDGPVDEARRAALHAERAAHLVVELGVDHGVVGPLVLPGLSSCLRCADLHRRDRDPAWPALAAQLATPRRYSGGSDVAVVTVIAGTAAIQALAFLDGADAASLGGTLELCLPDYRLRRRSRLPHPECDCMRGP